MGAQKRGNARKANSSGQAKITKADPQTDDTDKTGFETVAAVNDASWAKKATDGPAVRPEAVARLEDAEPLGSPVYALLCCLALVAAAACYTASLNGSFVYDDVKCVVDNPHVSAGLEKALSSLDFWMADYWGTPLSDELSHKSWRPLTTLSFAASASTNGLDPYAFHLANMALHVAVTLMVMIVAHQIFVSDALLPAVSDAPARNASRVYGRFAVVAAGLLFALHPMHSESVSNVTNRSELMSALLQLLAFAAYTATLRASFFPSLLGVVSAIVFTCAAALCKETGIMVAACLVAAEFLSQNLVTAVADWLFSDDDNVSDSKHRSNGKEASLSVAHARFGLSAGAATRAATVTIATTAFMYFRLSVQGGTPTWYSSTNPAANEDAFWTRFYTFAYLDWFHFRLLLWPTVFCPDWRNEIGLVKSLADPKAAVALIFLACIASLVLLGLYCAHKRYYRDAVVVTAGLAWLILPFIPASNIFFYVGFVVAERVTYAPSIGFCLLLAALLARIHGGFLHVDESVGKDSLSKQTGSRSHGKASRHRSSPVKTGSLVAAVSRPQPVLAWGLLTIVLALYVPTLLQRDAEWADELSLWKSATKTCPHNYVSHVLLGNVYDKLGEYEKAMQAYDEAIKHNEYYLHANLNAARVLRERLQQSERALTYLDRAIMSADTLDLQVRVVHALALCHGDVGNWDEAISYFSKLVQAVPDNLSFKQGLDYAQQMKRQAADHVRNAKREPKPTSSTSPSPPATSSTGHQQKKHARKDQEETGRKIMAKQETHAEQHREPERPTTLKEAADTAVQREEDDKTSSAAQTEASPAPAESPREADEPSAAAPPIDVIALFNEGVSHARKQEFSEAVKVFLEAARHASPHRGSSLHHAGVCYLELGKQQEAIEAFKRAVEVDPLNEEFRLTLALTMAKHGELGDAEREFDVLVSQHPDDPKYPFELGTVYFGMGLHPAAFQQYEAALATSQQGEGASQYRAKALVNMGVMYFKSDQLEEARDAFEQALQHDPLHPNAAANRDAIKSLLEKQQQ